MVEDEPRIAEIATDSLRLAGDDVVVADDGVRALDLARAEAIGLVVLDLGLPRLDGIEAAGR